MTTKPLPGLVVIWYSPEKVDGLVKSPTLEF